MDDARLSFLEELAQNDQQHKRVTSTLSPGAVLEIVSEVYTLRSKLHAALEVAGAAALQAGEFQTQLVEEQRPKASVPIDVRSAKVAKSQLIEVLRDGKIVAVWVGRIKFPNIKPVWVCRQGETKAAEFETQGDADLFAVETLQRWQTEA